MYYLKSLDKVDLPYLPDTLLLCLGAKKLGANEQNVFAH